METDHAIRWDEAKNHDLRRRHGVGFEDIVIALQDERLLDDIEHHNQDQFGHQRILVVEIEGYAYAVPYVEDETGVFFKTLYPSRRLTRQYLELP